MTGRWMLLAVLVGDLSEERREAEWRALMEEIASRRRRARFLNADELRPKRDLDPARVKKPPPEDDERRADE